MAFGVKRRGLEVAPGIDKFAVALDLWGKLLGGDEAAEPGARVEQEEVRAGVIDDTLSVGGGATRVKVDVVGVPPQVFALFAVPVGGRQE